MSKKILVDQYFKPTDHGYLREHQRLTQVMYDLVGEKSFTDLAKVKGRTERKDWHEDAHQAAEDAACYYILTAEHSPTEEEARKRVLDEYGLNLNNSERAAGSAATRKH